MRTILYAFLWLVCGIYSSCAQDDTPAPTPESTSPETATYLSQVYSNQQGSLPYRIMYPEGYDGEQKFPILFFLHGAGERGNNNSSQLTHGGSLFLNAVKQYPCIVVFPQCASNDWWANNSSGAILSNGFPPFQNIPLDPPNPSMGLLEQLIDSLTHTAAVDTSRVYIAGLSMGGMGTAQLLAKKPTLFAAGVVIAGIAPLDFTDELSQTPTWIFHGSNDSVVAFSHGQAYFDAIDDGMGTHRFTVYPGVGHLSWDAAFAEPDFLSWIFSKSN
ncbi:MAG: prolyl oligopeptidase family serine peptidase [Bacteroidota bacterium]